GDPEASSGEATTPASGAATGDTQTATGALVGTPAYMAPEQFRGEPAGPHTDQYSFCVALYEALYDARPSGTTVTERVAAVAHGDMRITPPSSDVPPQVEAALLQGLSGSPGQRHPSMEALLIALERDVLDAQASRDARTRFGRRSYAVGALGSALGVTI